jgi:hypothetical protein
MMKRTIRYLIIAFFMFISFKAQAYALKMEFDAPQEMDEGNLEQTGLMVPDKNMQVIVRPNVEYRAQGLRNPFEQSVLVSESTDAGSNLMPEATKLPQLTVQGIIWGSSLPQAIINNKVVKVGDVLEGADIIEINKEGITVLFAGVDHKLTTVPAAGQ